MFRYLFFLSLLAKILFQLSSASLYVTGSSDTYIKIWNDSSLLLSRSISRKIMCLDIDYNRNFIVTGTDIGKVVIWDIETNSTIDDNGSETVAVKSILIINNTHCLSAYNGFVIFWSLPELHQIIKITDTNFKTIGDMKYLKSENIVLIINVEKNMIVFSLNNSAVIKVNSIAEEGYSFDVLNSTFIYAPCTNNIGSDVCLYGIQNGFSLIQTNLVDFSRGVNFPALKILNTSFFIFSTSDGNFGYVKRPNTLNECHKGLNKILSLDILNNTILAAHQNGSISHFNKNNFNLIKTFNGHSPTFSINVIKKIEDKSMFEAITNMNGSFSSVSSSFPIISTSSINSLTVTSSPLFVQNISFHDMNLDQVLEFLNRDIDLNDCITNCSGNGICKLADNGKLLCDCFGNYAGPKCEINTLPCCSNPCRNNASCIDNLKNKTYTCECYSEYNQTSLYYGNNCEYKVDVCENEKCSDNGVCFDDGNEAKCKCYTYFNGEKCEVESNEMKSIKLVISTASIIAIIILVMTYCFLIICDISKLFGKNRKPTNNHQSHNSLRIKKFTYVN